MDISPLTKKQVEPKNSSTTDHSLFCNYSATSNDSSIITCEKKMFLLELKESLLVIMENHS